MYLKIGGFELDPFGELAKKQAVEKHGEAVAKHHRLGASVQRSAEALFKLRSHECKSSVEACEAYVSELANAPKEFESAVGELVVKYREFTSLQELLLEEAQRANVAAGKSAGAGAAAGVAVAAFAPTAAMAVATTFGTASTGAAIAGLAGAAKTSAALAWLGGGAMAAGGGGVAAGNALLALAGPVGWAIGGAALIGSGLMLGGKNGEVVSRAYKELGQIEEDRRRLERAKTKVDGLRRRTRKHVRGVREQLLALQSDAPDDYLAFDQGQRDRLKALINNVRSLGKVMGERVTA